MPKTPEQLAQSARDGLKKVATEFVAQEKIVPREPTQKMIEAGTHVVPPVTIIEESLQARIWKAMWDAADDV